MVSNSIVMEYLYLSKKKQILMLYTVATVYEKITCFNILCFI